MAGAGTKLFVDGQILTAAQVNTYLQDQVIMRFANAASRDAAFGGVGEPTLAEGMFCYLDDTNVLQSYNGSAWVNVVSSTYPPGFELITTCTVTSTGGTSATATGGVVTIGSGNTTLVVANAFSAAYDNYRIILSGSDCSIDAQGIKMLLSGIAGNNYFCYSTYQAWGVSSPLGTGYATNNSGILIGFGGSIDDTNLVVDVYSPFLAKRTGFTMQSTSSSYFVNGSGLCDQALSSTGFTIDPDGSATLSGGTIRVYGYRNS